MEEKKDYRKELFYEKKNGYDSMDAAAREAMEAYCEGYKAYLNDSRTEREAVANAIRLAERYGAAVDESRCRVDYIYIGSNLMPDITVVPLEGDS